MAYSIEEGDAYHREVGNLAEFSKSSDKKSKLLIVTFEEEKTIKIEDKAEDKTEDKTIEVIPLKKLLLES